MIKVNQSYQTPNLFPVDRSILSHADYAKSSVHWQLFRTQSNLKLVAIYYKGAKAVYYKWAHSRFLRLQAAEDRAGCLIPTTVLSAWLFKAKTQGASGCIPLKDKLFTLLVYLPAQGHTNAIMKSDEAQQTQVLS